MEPSESDLELVHADGTVTDKRDNIRRQYADHVAHVIASRAEPPTRAPRRTRLLVAAAGVGAAAGAAGAALVHLVRW